MRRRHASAARVTATLAALALLAVGSPSPVSGQGSAYANFAELTRQIQDLAAGSELVSVESIGASHDGREIWLMTVAAPGDTDLDERPGVLVVGNLEGDHVAGSVLALEAARHLVRSADDDEGSRALADHVFYIVPRLNPDGAEAMFAPVKADRRRNAAPYDDDNDGRTDEDPAEDLNGDGVITVMRVADPDGEFVADEDDPRLLRRADAAAGESGEYSLYVEGVDSDGDGFLNEDGPGGVDLNRNFQHAYPYWQADAGVHMVSEPESRALMDFVIAHRNIGAILTFGHSDNLVTPPDGQGNLGGFATLGLDAWAAASNDGVYDVGVFHPERRRGFGFFFGGGGGGGLRLRGAQPGRDNDPESGRRPATSVNREDVEYFGAISDAYREITGIEKVGVNREPEGAFFQYGYFQYGVPSFSTQGWALPSAENGADGNGGSSSADATILAALEAGGIDAFVDWAPHDHPELGEVEIGGFRPYATSNPPADALEDLGRQHGEFVLRLASMLPRVRIVSTDVTAHGGGLFTVTAEVENAGYLPTALRHGVVAGAVQPVTVQLQVPPTAVLTGADKTVTFDRLDGSGGRERVRWVIRAVDGDEVEIRLRSDKGGNDSATVTLR